MNITYTKYPIQKERIMVIFASTLPGRRQHSYAVLLCSILLTASMLALAGCASTSASPDIEVSKVVKRLAKAAQDKQVVFKTKYQTFGSSNNLYEGTDSECLAISPYQPLETSVSQWARVQADASKRTNSDLYIAATWTCKHIYTDKSGATAALALFSVGLIPVASPIKVSLDLVVYKNNKKIFAGQYSKVDEANINLWSREKSSRDFVLNIANRLVKDFTVEFEGSDALEN